MVDRMRDALAGEMNRRQELLRAAGTSRTSPSTSAPAPACAIWIHFPALFIVVDEFSGTALAKARFCGVVRHDRSARAVTAHPSAARLQRLEEGKLRGLDSHLSYRIGLKTFSAGESRSVLGVPDAYHLPSVPGSAFLKCDADEPIRFNASYVSGEYVKPRKSSRTGRTSQLGARAPKLFTATPVEKDPTPVVPVSETPDANQPETSSGPTKTTLLDVVVSRLQGTVDLPRCGCRRWMPALRSMATARRDMGNAHNANWGLRLPIGVVDRPYDQRRDVLLIDLSGASGNIAVVGGPQSGKSTAIRSLITAAAAAIRRSNFSSTAWTSAVALSSACRICPMSAASRAGWMVTVFVAPSQRSPVCSVSGSCASETSGSNRCATSASARPSWRRCHGTRRRGTR